MTTNKAKKRISEITNQIIQKKNEIDDLEKELIDLETTLKYDNAKFVIKCSDSSLTLYNHLSSGDRLIDIYSTNAASTYLARSAKEKRAIASSLFEEYLKNGTPRTIATSSAEALNEIGEIIAEKGIIPDDIKVILYSDEYPDGLISHYSRDGYLINWPMGALN